MRFHFLNQKEDGFTLVEIAVVMIIAGLILIALVTSYLRWNDILRSSKTKESMAIVSDALSAYASRNFRIPCPADPAGGGPEPFGAEIGSGANGNVIGSCNNVVGNEAEGIVPFATLGLDALDVVDGWGNYLTYQVSPVFTQNMDVVPTDPPTAPAVQVHAKCRTLDWIEGTVFDGTDYDGGRNVAIQKARFCCVQPVGTETQVFSTSATDVPPNSPSLIYVQDGAGWYDRVNALADPYVVANPFVTISQSFYETSIYGGGGAGFGHTDMVVYALISHGKNGLGAFLVNGTANRVAGALTSELVNATRNNQNVYDLPHDSSNNNTYYDDIVSWQTQSDLLARLKRDSCAAP